MRGDSVRQPFRIITRSAPPPGSAIGERAVGGHRRAAVCVPPPSADVCLAGPGAGVAAGGGDKAARAGIVMATWAQLSCIAKDLVGV